MIKNIESNTRKQKKIALLVFLCFLLGIVPNPRSVESENTVLERNENKISSRSAGGIQPNLTRTGYPIILNNETNQDIWDSLYGKDADDIRIAYYSSNNEWKLTAFQIDEKAYFRDYSIEM